MSWWVGRTPSRNETFSVPLVTYTKGLWWAGKKEGGNVSDCKFRSDRT